jgi:hypothetical protein
MGNILSNTSNLTGNSSGILGLSGDVENSDGTKNSFVQNLTDILLELNLLNTGNYDLNKDFSSKKEGPRSEFNYSYNAYNKPPQVGTKSPDLYNHIGRPVNAAGKYIDLFGIPYTTTEGPIPNQCGSGLDCNSVSAYGEPPYNKAQFYINENNSFYNVKRAVCNKTTKVPIPMVGVDLPADSPDMKEYSSNESYLVSILNSQKNGIAYKLPTTGLPTTSQTAVSDMVDSCLTYGTTTGITGGGCVVDNKGVCVQTTDGAAGSSVPAIPDLTPTNGLTLNDFGSKATTTTKPRNIYDKELSDDCITLLNSLIIDSYTTPNIRNYSKWSPTDVSLVDGIASGTTGLLHDWKNHKIALVNGLQGQNSIGPTDTRIPKEFNGTSTNLFGQGPNGTTPQGAQSAVADMNKSCQDFEQDLCAWYYYYDINDGINPLNSTLDIKYSNNLQYLASHLPDCRCESFMNANGQIQNPDPKATGSAYQSFYFGNKCNANYNYGRPTDDNGGKYPTGQFAINATTSNSGTTLANIPTNLYNAATTQTNYIAYRRQFDPIGVSYSMPGTSDKIWGMVRDGNRINSIQISNYTCNMSITNNISNVSGNVVVGGISMTCGLPAPCSGEWENVAGATCSATCNPDGTGGTGTIAQIYRVKTPAANGGPACSNKAGETRNAACTGTSCPPLACTGSWDTNWSACSSTVCNQAGTQQKVWKTTTAAKYGGACPSGPQTQSCTGDCSSVRKNCVGSWVTTTPCNAACGQSGQSIQTYTITQNAVYGGAACPNPQGDVRTQTCLGPVCGAVNCVGNWENTAGAKCSATCPTTTGTISQTWKTLTAAGHGGTACPSPTTRNNPCSITCGGSGTISGGEISRGASGSESAAAAAAAAASSGSASSNIDPAFTGVYLIDPSKSTPTYNVPLAASSPILMPFSTVSASLTVNTAIVYTFTKNYDFLLYLLSDPSKVVICPLYVGSTCPTTTTSSGNISGSCSPYIVTLPFLYGSTTSIISYQLGVRNKPDNYSNPINPQYYNIPLKLKQYSMTLSAITISMISGKPYVAFKINPNTTDSITGLRVRIVLIPESGTSPELFKNYPDLLSTLKNNNNVITIGGSNMVIEPIVYNYKIMLNETASSTSPVTYSGGYQMNYDQTLPLIKQGSIDFSRIFSNFNSVTLQYMNYNNDNSITNIIENDTLLIGSTILLSYDFNCIDNNLTSIKVYYDTNTAYIPSATSSNTSVLILQTSNLGTLNQLTNSYTSTLNFICPFINATSVIFYIVASGSSSSVYSTPLKVILPQISSTSNIQNWAIIANNISSDMTTLPTSSLTPVLNTNQTIISINNYFTAGKNGNYKYIIYNQSNASYYGSNATPVPVSSSGVSPNYTIFKSPYTGPQPVITIASITSSGTSIYTPSTTNLITLEIGSELTLNYQITNITTETNFQLNLSNIRIVSFTLKNGSPTTGNITFSVFGDLTVTNPTLILTSYGIWNSTAIPVKLNNMGASKKTLSTASTTPASSVSYDNLNNPSINILAPNNDKIISNIIVNYPNLNENKYFTQLSSFGTPLSISNANFTFKTINFSLPFSYIFYASATEGYNSNNSESFTNATQLYLESKSKKATTNKLKTSINSNVIESFTEHLTNNNNNIIIDTLTLDFSSSTLEILNVINLMFSNYTSVTIQNLVLIFGTLSLDNKKFNINFIQDSKRTTQYTISNITFIGSLSTNITLTSQIPGLSIVNYSVNRKVNNNYALILPLEYSNGSYVLPQDYQSKLTSALNSNDKGTNLTSQGKPVQAPESVLKAPTAASSDIIGTIISYIPGLSDFLYSLSLSTGQSVNVLAIILFIIILIILFLLFRTIFYKKRKK